MNTPTPETDANQVDAIKLYTSLNARIQCHLNFARKLERERDEARTKAANCIPQLDWEILRAELTQLRKVCDELAKQLEFHRQQMVGLRQQTVGLRREIEHQKARVAAWEKVASPYPPNAADQAQPR